MHKGKYIEMGVLCILRVSCRAIVEASILIVDPISRRYCRILSRRIA